MDDPTERDPANFPGNPNPPAKIPDTSNVKPPAAAPKTSAGTGALPPSAAEGDVPPSSAAAPSEQTFRVYSESDGRHSIFQLAPDGTGERVGTANADDTQKILDTVGTFNESTKSWDVPPEAAKALMQGKLPLPDYIAAKWAGGEQGAVRGMIGQKFLSGEFTPEDAVSRGNPELLSSQLKEAPIFAWQGGFGATVAKMWEDAKAAGVGGTARRAAGEIAQATPELLNMGGEAAKDAGIIGGGAALMALAAGTTGPAGPAALAAAGGALGLNYGLFKHTMDNSAGNTAIDMLGKGFDPETVKTMAPLAGAINGALMIGQFKYMTAGMQRSFIGKVLDSDSVKGMLARYIVDAGKGTTLATAQEAVNIAVNNIGALLSDKPEGINQQPISDLVNTALTAAPVMAAMGIAGAALEKASGKSEANVEGAIPLKEGEPAPKLVEAAAAEGGTPKVETPPEAAGATGEENQYVLNRDMNLKDFGEVDKTAQNAREEYSGIHNEQLVRGNQLADEIKRDVPDPADRQGMFWYKAAEGDKAVLEHALQDPDLEQYHEQIQRALDLPDNAVKALEKVDQYYKESGEVSTEVGTIRNVLENYQNRLYQADGEPTRTEAAASGLKQTTGHAKQRVFDTEFDAARAGKIFATTDVADALALHNGEMSRVNAARSLADKLADSGLGAWKSPDNAPEGWKQVGNLNKDIALKGKDGQALIGEDGNQVHSRSNFYAPEGIADGLKAIADPDWTKKMDALKNIQSAQGAVKTGFLSWSFFHHLSFISQLVYRGDFSSLMQIGNMDEALAHPDFLENEKDFALHGGMTSQVEANADIERQLSKSLGDETLLGKAKDLPLVKQVLEQTDKNANFLFGKMQRLWKTNTYAAERSNWIAKNLDASNEEVTTALRGIAASTNDIFGGQNWEAMGMTKSNLSLLRLGILAPDWTASNISLLKHAVGLGDNAAENSMSRAHLIKALAVGMIGTELMNKVLTGHFTNTNKPGHKLEVEVAPNVYVSLIRGGPQDILKLGSMFAESGAAGVDRFAAGKLSPAARIAIGLASNTQYGSKPVVPATDQHKPVAATYDVLKYVLSNASPIPLGVSNLMQYAGEKHKTALGAAAVGSGIGRYSPPPKRK